MLETYATDINFQKGKPKYKGIRRIVEFRPETIKLIERSRGMVRAFFSDVVFNKFDQALRTDVSLDNIPNINFEKNRTAAIVEMAKELGIDNRSF